MVTVFFFAPLWRRAKVLTDMEFAELRYSGPAAPFLRGFRAVYLAIPVNTIIWAGSTSPCARSSPYVWVMIHYLPPSLRGLMLAGFAAAYMSTIGTHLNLGASYLINDLYKRFFVKDATEHHYVNASRLATIFVALLSAGATAYMQTHGASIAAAWKFLLALGAGAGLVFMLRWYWWRINAWSKITAMTAAATISLTLESSLGLPVVRLLHTIDPRLTVAPLNADDPHAFAWLMLITTALTTSLWLIVTLLTQPESEATLRHFYDLVKPAPLGWKHFATPSDIARPELRYNFLHWVLGFSLIYLMLFGVGNVLFSRVALGLGMMAGSLACLGLLFWSSSDAAGTRSSSFTRRQTSEGSDWASKQR